MPVLSEHFYSGTAAEKTNKYIETGCYRGDGLNLMTEHYDELHSIELSETWYKHCVDRFKDIPKVYMHFGNSKYLLPEILATINEPVTVYLDGHFSAGETAIGDELIDGVSSAPLLTELALLQARPYNDIIIIDDCRMLGKRGWINKGSKGGMWPEYEYDWTAITEDAIRELMKPNYDIFKNNSGIFTNGPRDQWTLAPIKV